MGFFDKKKEESNVAPPMMPPVPPQVAPSSQNNVPNEGKLNPPLVPGMDSLNDIKSQIVTSPNNNSSFSNNNSSKSDELENFNTNLNQNSDSLFDLSDLDFETGDTEELDSNEVKLKDSNKNNSGNNLINDDSIDANIESKEDLSFVKRGVSSSKSIQKDEPLFVTTSQFKSLLEIVENVKSKVKESSETHLRLMDIKSEEDIEYENLRKSFQFIEDKLYEVDSLIFDK